ncbi:MAG: hypothetical protein ACPLY7_00250, partial [Microgenomates group bacterium]
MTNKETQNITNPVYERYKAKISEFTKEKEEISTASQVQIMPESRRSLWKKIFNREEKEAPKLVNSSPAERLADLETKFNSWIFSDRKMVVCHLRANPDNENKIIINYLQSAELLHDPNTFGQFLEYWFLEYFQQVNSGPIENLLTHIETAES